MKKNANLSAERLRELLHYDPETGIFTWRVNRTGGTYAGDIAGRRTDRGYIVIRVDGTSYLAHRLAWLYMTGEWPPDEIDHINRCRSENRFSNLREATRPQNMANRPAWSSSGLKGARRQGRQWVASIQINGVHHYLGRFCTPESAHAAYRRAFIEAHGPEFVIPEIEAAPQEATL